MTQQQLEMQLESLLPKRYAVVLRSQSGGFLLLARDGDGKFTRFFNSKQRLLDYLEQLDL